MSTSVTSLSNLPQDALRRSFSCLNAKELAYLALTSKFFHQLSEEIVQDILREIQHTNFPLLFSKNLNIPREINMKRLLYRLSSTQVYTIGGAFNSDQVNCFLPKNNQWHITADMSTDRENSVVTSVRGYVVTMSGEDQASTSNVEMFSPLENSWASLPSLPMKMRRMASVSIGDKVIVLGGVDVDRDAGITSAHVLDFNFSSMKSQDLKKGGMSWTVSENVLLQPRSSHSAAMYDDEIWVAGGTTSNELSSKSVETICLKNGSLQSSQTMPSMNKGRRNFKLMVVKGKLYAVGGDDEASIECFNSETDEWEMVTTFPAYKSNFAATTDGENIFIFGGQCKRRSFLSSWECYNVASETWTVKKGKIPSNDSAGFSHGSAITMDFANMTW